MSRRYSKSQPLTLTRAQADKLLKLLHVAAKGLDTVWPSTARDVRDIYAELAEQYANAGYDVAEIELKK